MIAVDASDPPVIRDLPIFPLGTVLFPGGVLPLRVFEPRYVDMVRGCLREDRPFGVCLITRGREVGEAAQHESIGCLARIADFDATPQPGVLKLRCLGGTRFEVLSRRVQKDGLALADVETLDDDPVVAVPDEFAPSVQLLRRIVQDLDTRPDTAGERLVEPPHAFDAAAWVANRLCEFLPLPQTARQRLMALDDPLVRLKLVHDFLRQRRAL